VHELSIALEVIRIAENQVGRDALARVTEVAVEVGDDACVEVGSLEFCLEALLTSPPLGRARPVITRSAGDVLRVSYLELDDERPAEAGLGGRGMAAETRHPHSGFTAPT
jgi:hypothetical protein